MVVTKKFGRILANFDANCVICFLKPLLYIETKCGLSLLKYDCPHSHKPKRAHCGRSSGASSYVVGALLALGVVLNFVSLLRDRDDITMLIRGLASTTSTLYALILVIEAILISRGKVKEINDWIAVTNSRCYFGIPTVFTKRMKTIALKTAVSFLATMALELVVISIAAAKNGSMWVIFNLFLYFTVGLIQCANLCEYALRFMIYAALFRSYHAPLKRSLRRGGPGNAETISKIRQFHNVIAGQWHHFNSYNGAVLVTCLLSLVVIVICNANLLVLGEVDHPLLIVMEIQTHCTFMWSMYSIGKLDELNTVSDDLLSFLFKFPISKLRADEAAQVEMLIYTLKIQKPVLKASDIFIVGTRLLAPISGTVVTYVLVALQFHKTWSK